MLAHGNGFAIPLLYDTAVSICLASTYTDGPSCRARVQCYAKWLLVATSTLKITIGPHFIWSLLPEAVRVLHEDGADSNVRRWIGTAL